MGFQEAIQAGFAGYVKFDGRAMRWEYWYWVLFIIVASVVFQILMHVLGAWVGILSAIFSLGTLLPGIAVGVRRLHDIDRSGWWLLIAFIPVIGWILLLVWHCTPGTPGPNRFGPASI
jgi:uncharacterized membrane protein YhaH (DUF805 family)